MHRLRTLSFLVIAFSVLGAASAVLAVVLMYTSKDGGSGIPPSTLLMGQAVLMGAVAAVGSIVSGIVKSLADRIQVLERQVGEAKGVPADAPRP